MMFLSFSSQIGTESNSMQLSFNFSFGKLVFLKQQIVMFLWLKPQEV